MKTRRSVHQTALFTTLTLLILLPIFLTGCGQPSGKPEDVAARFLQALNNHESRVAYDLLCDQQKQQIKHEDFELRNNLRLEIIQVKEIKELTVTAVKSSDPIGGRVYPHAVKVTALTTSIEQATNQESTDPIELWLVDDYGNWRIYSTLYDTLNQDIARHYLYLGDASLYGRGREKAPLEAIHSYKKSLQYNANYHAAHQGLCKAYGMLGRYDEAIEEGRKALELAPTDQAKADCFNTLGIAYEVKGNRNLARENYRQGLKLDPGHELLQKNMKRVGG